MSNTTAKWVAIVAGILLLVGGLTGFADMKQIQDFVEITLGIHNSVLHIVFLVLLFLAALGGIIVIVGGLLIGKGMKRIGKFLIGLGAGMGLLGFIIAIILIYYRGGSIVQFVSSIGIIGVILAIIACSLAD
jgi:hypothetical protein